MNNQEHDAYKAGFEARFQNVSLNPYKRLSGLYYRWLTGWKHAYYYVVNRKMGAKPIANDNVPANG